MTITVSFSIEELETLRQNCTLNAARIGLRYAKAALYNRSPEGSGYFNTLDCGTQDAESANRCAMYFQYRDYVVLRQKITTSFEMNGVEIVDTPADIVLQGIFTILREFEKSTQFDKMLDIMCQHHEALLTSSVFNKD
jgi:hypothetical protein